MGYTTTFVGQVSIQPPLSLEDYQELKQLAECEPGKVEEDESLPVPPDTYCQWVPTPQGDALKWDHEEKFYDSVEWMTYITAKLAARGYVCNGEIRASGEESGDLWTLVVKDNSVSRREATVNW